MIYLTNKTGQKIGIDEGKGGALAYFSDPKILNGDNLINSWDHGREIQQSYYGDSDGSSWAGKPWVWNPVQAGSWSGVPSKVLECSQQGSNKVITKVNPRNWGGQELMSDVLMTSVFTLYDNYLHIQCSMKYSGNKTNTKHHQECPAVFTDRRLGTLVSYTGDKPWTRDSSLNIIYPPHKNTYYTSTEPWSAYVNENTRTGLGVFTPKSVLTTCYRVGNDGSTIKSDCSYFAPLMIEAILPGMTLSYDVYVTTGDVSHIRETFLGIRNNNNNPPAPVPVPSPKPTPPHEEPHSNNQLQISQKVTNSWQSGNDKISQVEISVKNTGNALIKNAKFQLDGFSIESSYNTIALPNNTFAFPEWLVKNGGLKPSESFTFGVATKKIGTIKIM